MDHVGGVLTWLLEDIGGLRSGNFLWEGGTELDEKAT